MSLSIVAHPNSIKGFLQRALLLVFPLVWIFLGSAGLYVLGQGDFWLDFSQGGSGVVLGELKLTSGSVRLRHSDIPVWQDFFKDNVPVDLRSGGALFTGPASTAQIELDGTIIEIEENSLIEFNLLKKEIEGLSRISRWLGKGKKSGVLRVVRGKIRAVEPSAAAAVRVTRGTDDRVETLKEVLVVAPSGLEAADASTALLGGAPSPLPSAEPSPELSPVAVAAAVVEAIPSMVPAVPSVRPSIVPSQARSSVAVPPPVLKKLPRSESLSVPRIVEKVVLANPQVGQVLITPEPDGSSDLLFTWATVKDAHEYEIRIVSAANVTKVEKSRENFKVVERLTKGRYRWQIRAVGGRADAPWVSPWSDIRAAGAVVDIP